MKTIQYIPGLCLILTMTLSGCNLPSASPETESAADILTAAAYTVEANLTRSAPSTLPVSPIIPTDQSGTPIPTLPVATTSAPPTSSPTQECDKAQFITDVTIPDDTLLNPGEDFTKTWRLKNIGTCSWAPTYAIVFNSGEAMGGPATQALVGNVDPGQTVDISVNLKAPSSSGNYTGYWKLRNASGILFAQVYVKIKVASTSSGFDLHSQAPSAEWVSGAGVLTFGGPDTDPDGFALYQNGKKLEDGSTPAKILEMHPQWVNDGVISGLYPPYTVFAGEHFLAKIGFLAFPDGSCGAGNVKFQLNYKESGTLHPLGEWAESCDGNLANVDVDLSSIAGKTVQFALAVTANGPSGQDWAVWLRPRVEIP